MSEYVRAIVRPELYSRQPNTIKYRTHFGVCIQEALKARGWIRVEDETWDFFWSEKQLIEGVFQHARMQPHMKVNHFRKYNELCKKEQSQPKLKKVSKSTRTIRKTRGIQIVQNSQFRYNFFPITFHLPLEYALFTDQFKSQALKDNNIWIMKPTAKSQGKGIFLFNKLSSISNWAQNQQAQPYIVQKYISNPLLIGGKKFDLRLYVLCTSYNPLTVYLYRSGFARFTHYRYDQSKLNNTEIHLTNVAIQKTTDDYNDIIGGKWLVDKLKLYLMSKYNHQDVNDCFYNITTLILKTLKSVIKLMPVDKHCFQLYGFDIMLDNDLKPWIIQVNGSPSMRANTPTDFKLKCGLIDDVLSIVDLQGLLTGQQEQVGGFDLICKNNIEKISKHNVRLGCDNDRILRMKRIAAEINRRSQTQIQQKQKKQTQKNTKILNVTKNNFLRKGMPVAFNNPTKNISKNMSVNKPLQTQQTQTKSIESGPLISRNRGKSYVIRQNNPSVPMSKDSYLNVKRN